MVTSRAINMTGARFGRLTVVGRAPSLKPRLAAKWICQCDCGKRTIVSRTNLRIGNTRSCGCLVSDTAKISSATHGLTRGGRGTVEYELWQGAKQRAKRFGVPFDLQPTDIRIPEFCPVFPNIRLVANRGASRIGPSSPTLDRLIPNKGYVLGNVSVISSKANFIKNSASFQELRQVADWLEGRVNG